MLLVCRRWRPEATAGLCVCVCLCVCVGVCVLPIEAIYTDSADTVIRCVRKSACVFGTATLLVRSINLQDLSSIYFFSFRRVLLQRGRLEGSGSLELLQENITCSYRASV